MRELTVWLSSSHTNRKSEPAAALMHCNALFWHTSNVCQCVFFANLNVYAFSVHVFEQYAEGVFLMLG